MNYFVDVLKRYVDFEGRARRKEFWMYMLWVMAIGIVLSMIPLLGFVLSPLFSLAVFLPTISVGARRMHDIGKSGWFLLLSIIPLVNIWLIILLATDGQRGDNQYGPDPKADEIAAM